MIVDAQTADRIGAGWLRAAVAPAGDFGRRAEDAALPFGPGDEASAQQRCEQIVRLAARLAPDGVAHTRAALRGAPDPIDIVSRSNAGDPLGDVDFFELGRFADALDATARAWDTAGGEAHERPPILSDLTALLAPGRTGHAFYLSDAFASSLVAARADYAQADAAAERERMRLAQALANAIGRLPEAQEFILMRDSVPRLPPGVHVVRETAAYRLVALDFDDDALAAAAHRDDAFAALSLAEDGVRRDLAQAVAKLGPALLAATDALGELDRTLGRVAFTQAWGGCVPRLCTDRFAFTAATFVPLALTLRDAGRAYTPITLDLAGAAVLTGPNMGGKSAALATMGFLALCVASGVPPPARSATLPLVGTVAWIGGEFAADRARLLSAFAAEVVRARDVLRKAVPPALFLIDEFARTTGPREGRALLVAFVEALARRADFALIATHFDGIAKDAQVPHFTIAGLGQRSLDAHAAHDIGAALNAVAQAMDYRIVPASAQSHLHSDALALAGLLGLDGAIIDRAAQLYAVAGTGPSAGTTE